MSQVQHLEELLSRVQRNRVRMEEEGIGVRRRMAANASLETAAESLAAAPVLPAEVEEMDAEATEADFDTTAGVIDLVNPTLVAGGAESSDESDFSDVSPVSHEAEAVMPTAAGIAFEEENATSVMTEDETDFSSASVPSVIPLAPDEVEIEEDEDLPVAEVVSVPHAQPSFEEEDEFAEETDEIEAEAEAEIEAEAVALAEEAVATEAEASAGAQPEAEELELVDSDTDETALSPASIVTAAAAAAAESVAEQEEESSSLADELEPELSRESFDATATASGPIVTVTGMSVVKSWTIGDVLARAWQLGNRE